MKVVRKPSFELVKDGVTSIKLNSWDEFHEVIADKILDYREFIFRGQANPHLPLTSSLDRLCKTTIERSFTEEEVILHLDRFKYAVRGRLPTLWSFELMDENDWWAMGQHHGLATPLLDWTESPYVAAYFAFEESSHQKDSPNHRAIFAIDKEQVKKKSDEIRRRPGANRDIVEFFSPINTDNARLVSQSGLFTRLPIGQDLEGWVLKYFAGEDKLVVLIKILIPDKPMDRDKFIRLLNRMNVNALTLFPDLVGASRHCNNDISIPNY